MDAVESRGRRWLIIWTAALFFMLVATRLAVVFLAINGTAELLSQLLSDAIAFAALLYVAFSGDRIARLLGVLLFAVWGVSSLVVALHLEGNIILTLRGEIMFLVAEGVVVQALAVLMAVGCLGFATALAGSRSIHRYHSHLRVRQARPH